MDENLARIKRNQKKLVPLIFALVAFLVLLVLLTPNMVKAIFTDDCTCYNSRPQKGFTYADFVCQESEVKHEIYIRSSAFCYSAYMFFLVFFILGLFKLKKTLKTIEK